MATSIASTYKIKHPKKRAFLEAYTVSGTVTAAATSADIARVTHYEWLKSDDSYRAAFEHAQDMAGDYMESEAYRRAVEGWDEPVFHKGEIVGHVRKFSDTLLIFMLKGAKPEKYKDRVQQEHSGDVKVEWVRVNHSPED